MLLEKNAARPAFRIVCARDKLDARARLPGASGWDRAAHAIRTAGARGTTAEALLPLLLPTSWMVNSTASSRVFQAWLAPPLDEAWGALLEMLDPAMAATDLAAMDRTERDLVSTCLAALIGVPGASLAAVSKVLAIARPQLAPLMDDAAIAFALGTIPRTTEKATATAPGSAFFPMVSWFAGAIRAHEAELVTIAREHEAVVLDAPQVLDRLLWFESFGYSEVPGWAWVEEDGIAAVVPSSAKPAAKGAPMTIDDLAPGDRDRARVLLAGD